MLQLQDVVVLTKGSEFSVASWPQGMPDLNQVIVFDAEKDSSPPYQHDRTPRWFITQ